MQRPPPATPSDTPGSPSDTPAPSDDALLRAVAGGERAALAALYDRYASVVLGVAVRILRSRRDGEDVVHDVFLEVWRRAGTYDPSKASVRTWLVLITRCRALDRRKSAAVSMTSPLVEDPRVAEPHESPDAGIDRARAWRALERLSDAQREVMLLAYFEGLSCSEIGAKLGVPLGTVKSRTAGALKALRQALADAETEGARSTSSPHDAEEP